MAGPALLALSRSREGGGPAAEAEAAAELGGGVAQAVWYHAA